MSKWRPAPAPKNCIYVIGDIHGQLEQLKLICNRILPLRKSDGGKDILICLGDYIDRGPDSPGVVDFLIKAKEKYKDQLILLIGNHEFLLRRAMYPTNSSHNYLMWMRNGGDQTLAQYLKRAGQQYENPYEFPRFRIKDIIPDSHKTFFSLLDSFYETDDFIFVHGGCDPYTSLNRQSDEEMAWDRDLIRAVISAIQSKTKLDWEKTIVTGHNSGSCGGVPIIHEKYMMIDVSCLKQLMVVEMNSMEAFLASHNKKRLIKVKLNETKIRSAVF